MTALADPAFRITIFKADDGLWTAWCSQKCGGIATSDGFQKRSDAFKWVEDYYARFFHPVPLAA